VRKLEQTAATEARTYMKANGDSEEAKKSKIARRRLVECRKVMQGTRRC